jgi:L-fuculose-phosphate aldolase
MANHGAVTYGGNLLDAFLKMETVEHFANICLVAHQLGSPRPLKEQAVDQLLEAKAKYLKNAR